MPAANTAETVARVKSDTGTVLRLPPRPGRESAADRDERKQRTPEALPVTAGGRITAVDALRGFSIFWILGGDGVAWALKDMTANAPAPIRAFGEFANAQLNHVKWEGFHFYDFVFPLFIFTTGVAIVLSLPRLVEREGTAKAHLRILRRFLLLFVLGLIYYGGVSHEWPDIRVLGVLQRIALCYLFASLLFLHLDLRGLVASFVALLVGYWALMTFVPVPGLGAGSYAPDSNLADWIDLNYLPGRLWDHTRDPEGMLSTLPAIGTCLMGVFGGMLLMNKRIGAQQKSLILIGAGIASVLAGYLWGLQFPLIKNVWTSSFVLVCGGYSLMLLGAMYQVIDVWGWKAWSVIFVWIGANAITLYVLHNIIDFDETAKRFVGGDVGAFLNGWIAPGTERFAGSLVGLAAAIALAGYLYRRKIFLRV